MPSPRKHLDKTDFKRWGVIVLIGAIAGALNAIGLQIIPEMQEFDNGMIGAVALALTVLIDLARRFISDTRLIPKRDDEKLIVVDDENLPIKQSLWSRFKTWIQKK